MGYRGEITMKFKTNHTAPKDSKNYEKGWDNVFNGVYEVGERIGQLIIMPYPQIEFEEVQELSTTSRGEGGYGSTGK